MAVAKAAVKDDMRKKLQSMTDTRLNALAFNVWRISSQGHPTRREKAVRLAPHVKAELAARAAK